MKKAFALYPVDRRKLLVAMMEELAGTARVLLQGDLSGMSFPETCRADSSQQDPFEIARGENGKEHVILKLEEDAIGPIFAAMGPAEAFEKRIENIQIEKGGRLEFMAGHNSLEESVFTGPGISETFVIELMSEGVISGYSEEMKRRD